MKLDILHRLECIVAKDLHLQSSCDIKKQNLADQFVVKLPTFRRDIYSLEVSKGTRLWQPRVGSFGVNGYLLNKLCVFIFAFFFVSISFSQDDSVQWKPVIWKGDSHCLYWDIDTIVKFKWNGDCKDGFIHGEGKLEIIRPDDIEEWYSGSFERGKPHGFCIYQIDTDKYEGNWQNGKMHGYGEYVSLTNFEYEGGWKNGNIEGEGKLIRFGVSTFEGNFVLGKPSGYGKVVYEDGGRYEGEWKNSMENGRGTFTFKSGSIYVGEFLNGKPNGKGVLNFINGDRYEGDFLNGERTGKGIYHYLVGAWYEGEFLNNKIHGEGKFYNLDGSAFVGESKNGDPFNGVVIDHEGFILARVKEGKKQVQQFKLKWDSEK